MMLSACTDAVVKLLLTTAKSQGYLGMIIIVPKGSVLSIVYLVHQSTVAYAHWSLY